MTTTLCCDSHIEGRAPKCCDPNDCGPCCPECPTCPTLAGGRARAEVERLNAELAAFRAECDKVGIPHDAAGLVRHHRANAALVAATDAHTEQIRLDPVVATWRRRAEAAEVEVERGRRAAKDVLRLADEAQSWDLASFTAMQVGNRIRAAVSARPVVVDRSCGGCEGKGAHRRWCPAVVTPRAALLGPLGERAESLGDTVGANEPDATNHLYAAASLLKNAARGTVAEGGPVSSTGHRWPCTRFYVMAGDSYPCTCGASIEGGGQP